MRGLHSELRVGPYTARHRIFMAPLTRCRASDDHMPTELMATYYHQRGDAGLIVTEATMVQSGTAAFGNEPSIHELRSIAGWRHITEAVHRCGGLIFLQLWHGGRACHPAFNDGRQPVAPSAIAIRGETHTPQGKLPHVVPRALADEELRPIAIAFRRAALNARAAGFDGVEIHAANGYLIDQFLRDGSNRRSGFYGGSRENRARLLFEIIGEVGHAVGYDRVGVRLSPLNSYNDMQDSDPFGLASFLARELNMFGLAYLHVVRGDFLGQQQGDVLPYMRALYRGVLIGNMGYTLQEAEQAILEDKLDAVSFGRAYIANPDLRARSFACAELLEPREEYFYTPGERGYTDYPVWSL